jgi:asparagine N-glycosylation enzyme membrane subunit Stt3
MGWRIFQAAVVAAVLFSNIHWHWTPNGYLASIIGIFAAFLATVVLTRIIDLWRRAKPTLL